VTHDRRTAIIQPLHGPSFTQQPGGRHRHHPGQGLGDRHLRPRLAGRHRAAHHRRADRDRERGHVYLRFAEAVGRLDLNESDPTGLPELVDGITSGAAKSKTSGAIEGAKDKLESILSGGDEDEEEEEEEEKPRKRTSSRSRSSSSGSRSRSSKS
jgi:hypothetical protein